jgi:Type I phosphodiesterase / nucleotide pyrophosphatase
MLRRFPKTAVIAASVVALGGVAAIGAVATSSHSGSAPQSATLADRHISGTPIPGRHSLLISVDGMHASDLAQYIKLYPNSNLAKLAARGTDYTNAQTTFPSDSFPGLASMVTGGTAKTVGLFYDNAYNRALYAPGSHCTGPAGTNVTYDETIAHNNNNLTDGGNWAGIGSTGNPTPSAFSQIDPSTLPLEKSGANCTPVYPNNDMFANTIFQVAHNANLYTAWSDKNPGYDWVNGPDQYNQTNTPAVTDLFTPDVKGAIPSTHAGNAAYDPTIPDLSAYGDTGTIGDATFHPGAYASSIDPNGVYTDGAEVAMAYDNVKVNAIINQIDGKTSVGGTTTPANTVPSIFGMNFQAVSVAQKVVVGGYYDNGTTFSPYLKAAFDSVDQAIGRIVTELHNKNLTDSTEIILSAKHGQSPKNRTLYHRIYESAGQLAKSPENSLTGFIAQASIGGNSTLAQETADDVALLWWQNPNDANIAPVTAAFNADPNLANLMSVKQVFPAADLLGAAPTGAGTFNVTSAYPDVFVQPQTGVMYSKSSAKIADHGGGAADDRNVPLLVVNGAGFDHIKKVRTSVSTTQIAPTILNYLGLDPQSLTAVRAEHTRLLPAQGDSAERRH